MKKKLAVLLLLFSFLSFSLFAEELPPMPDGPLILTSVTPDQLSADYWINRLPNPDLVLKTPQEIHQLNQEIRAMLSSQIDIFELESVRLSKELLSVDNWLPIIIEWNKVSELVLTLEPLIMIN